MPLNCCVNGGKGLWQSHVYVLFLHSFASNFVAFNKKSHKSHVGINGQINTLECAIISLMSKPLSQTNRYLRQSNGKAGLISVASSTAVETGKPTEYYIKRSLNQATHSSSKSVQKPAP